MAELHVTIKEVRPPVAGLTLAGARSQANAEIAEFIERFTQRFPDIEVMRIAWINRTFTIRVPQIEQESLIREISSAFACEVSPGSPLRAE